MYMSTSDCLISRANTSLGALTWACTSLLEYVIVKVYKCKCEEANWYIYIHVWLLVSLLEPAMVSECFLQFDLKLQSDVGSEN